MFRGCEYSIQNYCIRSYMSLFNEEQKFLRLVKMHHVCSKVTWRMQMLSLSIIHDLWEVPGHIYTCICFMPMRRDKFSFKNDKLELVFVNLVGWHFSPCIWKSLSYYYYWNTYTYIYINLLRLQWYRLYVLILDRISLSIVA